MLWLFGKFLALVFSLFASTQVPSQEPAPLGAEIAHRYLVGYRNNTIPPAAQAYARAPGVTIFRRYEPVGMVVLQTDPGVDEAASLAALRADPAIEFVIHDRVLSAHNLILRAGVPAVVAIVSSPTPTTAPYDTYYTSTPQGWGVIQSGGYGAATPGGPIHGPWDTTLGAGVRVAILDSGVDAGHPDIAPNLAFNFTEIDQSVNGLPSPCDDGSPQDQQGHGTWTASLAAGARGPDTGLVLGVAPGATILNVKVLERLPDPASTAPDVATQCETGQAGGLLSWVIQGIDDAVAQHADVINLSLGTLVDLDTGEGAGLKAAFDRVTYAATQAGAVVIASAGNDGFDLSDPRYIELPAQARGVLAIVASTNPACAENLTPGALCAPGAVTLSYYSNYGAPLDAIAAPGGSYPDGPDSGVSGWIRGACSKGLPNTLDGPPNSTHSFGCFNLGHASYLQAMGTSASAALASGAVALLRAAHPTWTPDQVVTALRTTADTAGSLSAAPLLDLRALIP